MLYVILTHLMRLLFIKNIQKFNVISVRIHVPYLYLVFMSITTVLYYKGFIGIILFSARPLETINFDRIKNV